MQAVFLRTFSLDFVSREGLLAEDQRKRLGSELGIHGKWNDEDLRGWGDSLVAGYFQLLFCCWYTSLLLSRLLDSLRRG